MIIAMRQATKAGGTFTGKAPMGAASDSSGKGVWDYPSDFGNLGLFDPGNVDLAAAGAWLYIARFTLHATGPIITWKLVLVETDTAASEAVLWQSDPNNPTRDFASFEGSDRFTIAPGEKIKLYANAPSPGDTMTAMLVLKDRPQE